MLKGLLCSSKVTRAYGLKRLGGGGGGGTILPNTDRNRPTLFVQKFAP